MVTLLGRRTKGHIDVQLWNFHYDNSEINQLFLIPDNIDKSKFSNNSRVDRIIHGFIKIRPPHGQSDEYLEISNLTFQQYSQKAFKNATPSLKQLDFMQTYHLRPLVDFPAWFIWAYPDVILWMGNNGNAIDETDSIDESFNEVMSFIDDGFSDDRQMYRKLIDTYKKFFRLEVSKS